jgi:hypothetical protein
VRNEAGHAHDGLQAYAVSAEDVEEARRGRQPRARQSRTTVHRWGSSGRRGSVGSNLKGDALIHQD